MAIIKTEGMMGGGIAQRVLLVMLGVLLPALLAFFIWLATSIVEIKVGVAETKRDVANLLEARRSDVNSRVDRNTRRLDAMDPKKKDGNVD